jgi:hypothetical protein
VSSIQRRRLRMASPPRLTRISSSEFIEVIQ